MVTFGPLTAEIGWQVWGTAANFNESRVFHGLVTALTSLNGGPPHFARCLASPGLVQYTFLGALVP